MSKPNIYELNQSSSSLYSVLFEPCKNLFFSPASILIGLNMLYKGAKGDTAKELENFLGSNAGKNFNINNTLSSANGMFINDIFELNSELKNIVNTEFKATFDSFTTKTKEDCKKAVDKINVWVSSKTNRMINKLLSDDDITDDTVFLILNAIYFKSKWIKPFDSFDTDMKAIFYNENGKTPNISMMKKTSFFDYTSYTLDNKIYTTYRNPEFSNTGCKVLSLELNGNLSMVIVMPVRKNEEVDKKCAENFFLNPNMFLAFKKDAVSGQLCVKLPKFKIDYKQTELIECLNKLGMKKMSKWNEAEFSFVKNQTSELYINKGVHQAVIDLNEEGVEASAATMFSGMFGSAGPVRKPVNFTVDNPFMFAICDSTTGLNLFMGKISQF